MDNKQNDAHNGQKPVKIVLADDDKDDQEIFQEAVNEGKINAEVTTVDNGQQLMDHLKDESIPNPDIIFMDVNMPKKDGKEALKEIKNDENLKDIPTVMLSGSKNQDDINDTYNAGASLYVHKPDSFWSIVGILKKIILNWRSFLFRPSRKEFFVNSEKNVPDTQKP